MDLMQGLQAATLVAAFVFGAVLVHRVGQRSAGHGVPRPSRPAAAPAPRPPAHIPVRGFDGIVAATSTAKLVQLVERKTRLSQANFTKDCQPVLESLAEFVQMLPASESHHHAHPGGLWQHLLEVADAALTFRAGMELPPGAGTEERKRLEHRWTYAVFVAALLHDVGKPVTDVRVTLYTEDPRDGRAWTPLAGPMRAFGAHWYSLTFADPTERDYQAHAKLGAMLLHTFVPPRVTRWLAEEGDVLAQLLAYLSGEDKDGALGSLIKRADSDSVRRNLLTSPRTRFATARARPLIERLMEALRRMLVEGASLPLNRPGAAGWVHDGKVYFVCARLADEVRNYLSQHESLQGVPGKDKNDRLFDTWQEYGAAETAPDGGAVWRVRVECEGWSPPDAFTVLCFAVDKLYPDASQRPAPMKGRVWLAQSAAGPAAPSTPSNAPVAAPAATPAASVAAPAPLRVPEAPQAPRLAQATQVAQPVAPEAAQRLPVEPQATAPVAPLAIGEVRPAVHVEAPQTLETAETAAPVAQAQAPAAVAAVSQEVEAPSSTAPAPQDAGDDDTLSVSESAHAGMKEERAPVTETPELGAPLRPRERGQRPAGAAVGNSRLPTPAATALMAWVAQSVGSGALKYNEDGALVHFVPEGALLLSPEIFRRFLSEHEAVSDGPIAALRQSHGDRAFARLQNELAKSGWTVRNGDENMHYYAFVKADKSLSRTASFCLLGKPELFWNPVPAPNERITRAPRPKRMSLPAGAAAGSSTGKGANTRSAA
ncbi:hypothetical protein EOE66_21535 [Rubrivivax rivuli]|uniref:HD/PDEase domain-containing protein n=1 Tax=Rubrivivax rivuli TaxID=1862385 RepID=A0A437R7W0_9BURK|nr:hypothetical protein EOE66_21535 [Rubrivivax rivuli]